MFGKQLQDHLKLENRPKKVFWGKQYKGRLFNFSPLKSTGLSSHGVSTIARAVL